MAERSPIAQPLHRELADLANAVYDPDVSEVGRWRRIQSFERSSGLRAAVFSDGQHQVLAFAGSNQLRDWRTNIAQAVGVNTKQYQQAIEIARDAKRQHGDTLMVVTGHSLGGGLATNVAAAVGIPAIVYNAAAVHDRTLKRNDIDPQAFRQEAESGQIVNYRVKGDIVNAISRGTLRPKPAGVQVPLGVSRAGPIGRHGIGTVLRALDESGLFQDTASPMHETTPTQGTSPDILGTSATTPIQAAPSIDPHQRRIEMAAAFRAGPADKAIQAFPELESAYKALEAVEKKAAGMKPQARDRIVSTMQEKLARQIEHGKPIPTPQKAARMVVNANRGVER